MYIVCILADNDRHETMRFAPLSSRKACSISRSYMAAPCHSAISADAWSRRQALSIRVPEETETSTHLEKSLSASHGRAAAKLAPSVGASRRLRCRAQSVHVRGRGGKHSPSECRRRQRRARTLRSPSPPRTAEQPQSLLHQSELHGGSVAERNRCRCVLVSASSGTRVSFFVL